MPFQFSQREAGGRATAETVVVLPTYNEAGNLEAMIEQLLALGISGLAVLVVDDNSPDGTGQIADELAARHPGGVRVLHRPAKQGLGRAYVAGMSRALEMGADYLVQMDADFSHPVSAIPAMLEGAREHDVVVGSRYVSGGGLDRHWSWYRRFLSWWANEVWSRTLLRLRVRDITAGFKCWRVATLRGIGLDRVGSNGYAFQVEMAYLTEHLGYRTREIPIYFEDRHGGKSKMDMKVKLQGAVDVFRIWRRHRRAVRRPEEPASRDPEIVIVPVQTGQPGLIALDGQQIAVEAEPLIPGGN